MVLIPPNHRQGVSGSDFSSESELNTLRKAGLLRERDYSLRFPKIGTGCDPWGDASKVLTGLLASLVIPGWASCKPSNQP